MRSSNSLKNIIWAAIVFFINMIITFIARKLFITYLGVEYNGLNSLLNSILSMLSIAELGISNAIIFNLYKPVSEGNKEKINSLLKFYKKGYNIIAIVILVLSLFVMPFLSSIVGDNSLNTNIHFAFLLVVLDSSFSYLLSYKRSIFIATQNERIIKKVHLGYIIIYNIFQILILKFTKNYFLFLIIKIVFTVIENVIISYLANKKYPYIKEKSTNLDKQTKNNIKVKIKALFVHKLAGFVVNGTDNILISIFFGVVLVGYYNNYYLIISAIMSLVTTIFAAITSSVGNLLVTSDSENSFKVYKNINFFNKYISIVTFIAFAVCIKPLIILWLGKEYLLSNTLEIIMAYYYFFRVIKMTSSTFKDAAGIYYEDRFVPVLESITNIVASLILIKVIGLAGVFVGTIISNLIVHIYSYPKFVYKKIFKKQYKQYYKDFFTNLFNASLCLLICLVICNLTQFDNSLVELIKNLLITIIIVTTEFIILNYKKDEFKYYKELLKKINKKIFKRKEVA